MKTNKKQKGFTLIEMLVVVGIIGILSTMLLVSVSRIRKSSVDTRRKANLENVRGAISMYYSVKSTWPVIGNSNAWGGLITTLSDGGYMSDTIKTDDDGDGIADYYVCECGTNCACNTGSHMKLMTRFEVSTNEDCTGKNDCPGDITGNGTGNTCCALEVK